MKRLVTTDQFYRVQIGALDWANPAMEYAFPNEQGALQFARQAAPRRGASVRNRFGNVIYQRRKGRKRDAEG